MPKYKIEKIGDTLSLFLDEKLIAGKWKNKPWHAMVNGSWAYKIDSRHFPLKVRKDIKLVKDISGWKK